MRSFFFFAVFATCSFATAETDLGDELSLPSSLLFGVGSDEDGNINLDLSADLDFISRSRLGLGYGLSQSDDVDLTTHSVFAELSSNPDSRLVGTIGADYWGNTNALAIRGLNLGVGFNEGNWQFNVSPSFRSIRLKTIESVSLSEYQAQSRTWGISVRYFGFENWSLGFGVERTRHSLANLNTANRRLLRFVTTSSAKVLASSLSKQRHYLHVDRYFDWGSAGIMCGRSIALIGDTDAGYCQSNLAWFVSETWELSLSIALQTFDSESFYNSDISGRYFF